MHFYTLINAFLYLIWNEIPSSIKEVSFYRFKKAFKAHFLSIYEIDKS